MRHKKSRGSLVKEGSEDADSQNCPSSPAKGGTNLNTQNLKITDLEYRIE